MRIAERVHLVGSGRAGFSLTDDYDCHVYALDGGSEVALIDAGGGRATDQLLANLRADGLDLGRVRHLLLTHGHGDHAAGAAGLREMLPGIRVYASPLVADWVSRGDDHAVSLDVARDSGMYPADFPFPACPVEGLLAEGDEVTVGDLLVRVVETPGHADGHLSFLVGDRLFAGDALFFGGRIVLQKTWDCSLKKSIATIEKLAGLEWDVFFPGHLAFALKHGKRHVEMAMREIRRLGVPKQLEV